MAPTEIMLLALWVVNRRVRVSEPHSRPGDLGFGTFILSLAAQELAFYISPGWSDGLPYCSPN